MTPAQTELSIAAEVSLSNAIVYLKEGNTQEAYERAYKAMDFLDAILSLECFEDARHECCEH